MRLNSALLFAAFLPVSSSFTHVVSPRKSVVSLAARREKPDYDYAEDDYDDYDYNNDYDETQRRRTSRGPRRNRFQPIDDLGGASGGETNDSSQAGLNLPSPFGRRSGMRLPESVSKALLAGVFVLGIGTGVTVDSAINTNPKDLASRDAVDRNAPNPTLCTSYGASAMAFDQRVFVSFDPFNVYVAQADVKPACVLRPANVVPILRDRALLTDKEVSACKANMNTWAFVGDLDDAPQLSCVYQSEDAQNEFLSDPKVGIGEDYLDDDRSSGNLAKSTGKLVKKNAVKKGSTNELKGTELKKVTENLSGMWSST